MRPLAPAERTRYYLALYAVPDPNDEANLWNPRSPTGGGCWGEAIREVPSVYFAQLTYAHRESSNQWRDSHVA
jgi:hypothetical protein